MPLGVERLRQRQNQLVQQQNAKVDEERHAICSVPTHKQMLRCFLHRKHRHLRVSERATKNNRRCSHSVHSPHASLHLRVEEVLRV